MRGSIVMCCVLGLAGLLAPLAQAKESPRFAWPDGQKAAVSLGYDDALDSQLDNAIPALDRHGLKGTFYIVPAEPPVRLRMDDWRAAARNGHELGNHSLFHQCSAGPGREWVKPERDLDAVGVAQMVEQVTLANTFLQAIDGHNDGRTFTAPCGDRKARDGDYIAALGDLFVGIKMVGGATVVPDMSTLDPRNVPAHVPVGVTGAQLIALVEEAARRGTMINFTFHGIGGDHLSVSTQAHEELLAYLDAHRDRYWTATFLEQMRWVRAQQEKAGAARPD